MKRAGLHLEKLILRGLNAYKPTATRFSQDIELSWREAFVLRQDGGYYKIVNASMFKPIWLSFNGIYIKL